MPYVQLGLLIGGTTALGAFLCGPGLWFLIVWLARPKPGQMWGGDVLMLFLLFIGSLFGAAVGFSSGLRGFGRRGVQPWGLAGWGGALGGFGLGLLLVLGGWLARFNMLWFPLLNGLFLLGLMFVLSAGGGLGGTWLEAEWRRRHAPVPTARPCPPKTRKKKVVRTSENER